jgi:hypothetical protein
VPTHLGQVLVIFLALTLKTLLKLAHDVRYVVRGILLNSGHKLLLFLAQTRQIFCGGFALLLLGRTMMIPYRVEVELL